MPSIFSIRRNQLLQGCRTAARIQSGLIFFIHGAAHRRGWIVIAAGGGASKSYLRPDPLQPARPGGTAESAALRLRDAFLRGCMDHCNLIVERPEIIQIAETE